MNDYVAYFLLLIGAMIVWIIPSYILMWFLDKITNNGWSRFTGFNRLRFSQVLVLIIGGTGWLIYRSDMSLYDFFPAVIILLFLICILFAIKFGLIKIKSNKQLTENENYNEKLSKMRIRKEREIRKD